MGAKDGRRHPCVKDCPRRSPTCHAECEAYRAYAKARAEIYDKRAKEFDYQSAMNDMEMGWADRARRKKGQR